MLTTDPNVLQGGFSFFSSSSAKYEEAHDLYVQAGNQFKVRFHRPLRLTRRSGTAREADPLTMFALHLQIDKQWKESGDMFCKAAEMSLKGDEKDDAANDFWTASKSYKKANPECRSLSCSALFGCWLGRSPNSADPLARSPHLYLLHHTTHQHTITSLSHPLHTIVAVASLQRTIQLYKEKGKFRQAADREKEIATILAQEGGDLNGALEAFEAAGELYSAEDAQA